MQDQQEPTTPTPKAKHDMTYHEAWEAQQHMVCAGCYQPVVAQPVDQEKISWTATCDTPDCPTPGYVTRSWLERQQVKNQEQLLEARTVLGQAAPWMNPHKGKAQDQLMKELGF